VRMVSRAPLNQRIVDLPSRIPGWQKEESAEPLTFPVLEGKKRDLHFMGQKTFPCTR